MIKLFVDANVVVAVLNKEYPLFSRAIRVLSLADHPRFQIYTSVLTLAIAFYFSSKKSGHRAALEKMKVLQSNLMIAQCGQAEVAEAINNKMVHDFEDGMQYYAALHAGCSIIVTEDKADYHFATLPVMNCEDCLRHHLWVAQENKG